MILNPKIFRAYDIRGKAFVDFDEDGFASIAQAFGQYVSQKFKLERPKVFVSGDGRMSMGPLFPAVIAGLEAAGCTVTWGGSVPTPINFFAFHEGSFDASIQISASHNPPQDNGLKLMDRSGSVCGDEIQKIRQIAECADCLKTDDYGSCTENCEVAQFLSQYENKLKNITPDQDSLKVVIDSGNSIAGSYYPEILRTFGHQVDALYCNLDPTFPNHQPDPERPENLVDLQARVKEIEADLGFAYDGDGDRVGVILKDGTMLLADHIFYVLASDFLVRNPNEKLVVDAMSSQTLIEKLKEKGAEVIVSPTGHSYIEQNMHEHGARLGGEQSGHFMFGEDFYGHDDACLASLRFIQAIQNNPDLIAEVTTLWPDLLEFSEKITVDDERKFEILNNFIQKIIPELESQNLEYSTLDGIRINFGKNQWAIVRCSNTSPKIAIRIEALDESSLNQKKDWLVASLESVI